MSPVFVVVCDVSTGVNITGTKDVKLGDKNYVLHCHTHHGEASVEWKALNTALPVDSCSSLPPHAAESGQACTKTHKGRTTLKFMVITLQSVGQFSCRGKDKLGNVVASKNVTVSPSPIPTHDLLTAMRIRGTQHRRDGERRALYLEKTSLCTYLVYTCRNNNFKGWGYAHFWCCT